MTMFNKILRFLKSRLGLSLVINLILTALIFLFLGKVATITFLIGVIIGVGETSFSIEFDLKE